MLAYTEGDSKPGYFWCCQWVDWFKLKVVTKWYKVLYNFNTKSSTYTCMQVEVCDMTTLDHEQLECGHHFMMNTIIRHYIEIVCIVLQCTFYPSQFQTHTGKAFFSQPNHTSCSVPCLPEIRQINQIQQTWSTFLPHLLRQNKKSCKTKQKQRGWVGVSLLV